MLLCDVLIDNQWALTYAQVRKLCHEQAVKVNSEIEVDYTRPVQPGDKIECGKHREKVL